MEHIELALLLSLLTACIMITRHTAMSVTDFGEESDP